LRLGGAAPRWHARFVLAAGDLGINEAHAASGALALLCGPSRRNALELLDDFGRRHRSRLDVRHHLDPR